MAELTLAEFLIRCSNTVPGGWLADDPCVYCGRREDELDQTRRSPIANHMTLEHIVPKSMLGATKLPKGWGRGERGWENHARACQRCNTARGNVPFIRWLIEQAERLGPRRDHPFRPGWRDQGPGWRVSKSS